MVGERISGGKGQWINFPALVAVTFWGSTFLVVKLIVRDDLSPLSLATLRIGFGALLLFAGLMFTEKDWGVTVRDLPMLALLGLCGLVIFQVFFAISLTYTTVSNVSVISATSPMIVAIIVLLTRVDTLRWTIVAGILLAFGGVTLIAQREGLSFESGALLGDILALLAAAGWAIFVAGQTSLLQRYSPTKVMAYAAAFGTVFILPFAAQDLASQNWGTISVSGWGLIVYYVVGSGYIATVLWSRAIRNWGPARTSAYSYLNPIFGILSGVIFLGESMVAVQIVGTLAVFAGLVLARR